MTALPDTPCETSLIITPNYTSVNFFRVYMYVRMCVFSCMHGVYVCVKRKRSETKETYLKLRLHNSQNAKRRSQTQIQDDKYQLTQGTCSRTRVSRDKLIQLELIL